jgi:AcrR family transcriptional regulator
LRTALGHAAERAEALQTSYNSSEQELQELRNAALETCRAVEEGEAQAGSSLASRLRALGGHVTERMRRALHLGVQKALEVVRSHYEVNFEALAEGYVVPEGVEDEVAMERVDALAADAVGTLAEAFESSSSRTLLMPPLLPPEDSRALGPFLFMYQYAGRAALVNKQITFAINICQCKMMLFVLSRFFVSPSS